MSHLLQMRGLKLFTVNNRRAHPKSHLLQMRGLKQDETNNEEDQSKSHLLQMRGLKLFADLETNYL